ncbi:hypothetical protein SK128_018127 [Halocaridina rubra]|uniref:Uncharacterized protein n=1 Tax=Halocaridina rubra TaxID=373956 RepID=A0AAN8WTH9_HALRR
MRRFKVEFQCCRSVKCGGTQMARQNFTREGRRYFFRDLNYEGSGSAAALPVWVYLLESRDGKD